MAKQNTIAKKATDFDSQSVTIALADGTEKSLSLADLNDEMVTRLALHGLSQKMGDSYAGAGGEDDPIAYAAEAVEAVIVSLREGNWTQRTGGTAGPRVTLLAEAIQRATGRDIEECSELVNDLRAASNDEENPEAAEAAKGKLDALRNNPRVKAAQSEIRAERAAAKAEKDAAAGAEGPDLDALLG